MFVDIIHKAVQCFEKLVLNTLSMFKSLFSLISKMQNFTVYSKTSKIMALKNWIVILTLYQNLKDLKG